ncbi:MAG: hypothetical protein V2I43_27840 [Parvularcula sp.]|jgi:hypothetical protein|nr:hypothetical protein [Parvularcula sp.]
MKKIVATTALMCAAIVTTSANAQSAGSVDMALQGEVTQVCGAFDFQSSPVLIDFGTLSDVEVGSQTPEIANNVTIVCNDPDGGIVNITSANSGVLERVGSAGGEGNEVGYTVRATGGSGLAFGASDLSNDVEVSFSGAPAFINGQSMTLRFAANGVRITDDTNANDATRTSVYAGTYTDLVTVSVTAN